MQSVLLNSNLNAVGQFWADSFKLPRQLVLAHVVVESAGNPYALRAEPTYRYLWDNKTGRAFRALTAAEIASEKAPLDFSVPADLLTSRDTEWWGQQCSWGPMQIMGAVARSFGFHGSFPALCDSDGSAGIHYGCAQLAALVKQFGSTWNIEAVSAAYNAGSPRYFDGTKKYVNQDYVEKIRAAGGFANLDLASPAAALAHA